MRDDVIGCVAKDCVAAGGPDAGAGAGAGAGMGAGAGAGVKAGGAAERVGVGVGEREGVGVDDGEGDGEGCRCKPGCACLRDAGEGGNTKAGFGAAARGVGSRPMEFDGEGEGVPIGRKGGKACAVDAADGPLFGGAPKDVAPKENHDGGVAVEGGRVTGAVGDPAPFPTNDTEERELDSSAEESDGEGITSWRGGGGIGPTAWGGAAEPGRAAACIMAIRVCSLG